MKKYLSIILIVLLCILGVVVYENNRPVTPDQQEDILEIRDRTIMHEEKFGGVYIDITIADFNALGFSFGDSVDLTFTNGYVLEDIPYYNGYYVDEGDPLLVGYPGYPYIRAGFNYGDDLWVVAGVSENDKATVTLREAAKYLDVQQARDIEYTDEQGTMSDEKFGNFRSVQVGNLKEGILCRSASPVDNQHKRAAVVDRLIAQAGVNFIINLSDGAEELVEHINKEDFNSPYFLSLYESNRVIPLDMSASYKTDDFNEKLVRGLTAASENEGPYLVHCVEGKDRTGYVCMIIEALAGASYDEIADDYMITYDNYYDINMQSDPARYVIIREKNINLMLEYVTGTADYKKINLEDAITSFLESKGMSSEAIQTLKDKLTN